MNSFDIVTITISIMLLVEGLMFLIFPKHMGKAVKETFKNKKTTIKYGLIEIIFALLILFLLAL